MRKIIHFQNSYFRYNLENIVRILFCITQILNVLGYISNAREMESLFSTISQSYIILNVVSFLIFAFSRKKNRGVGAALGLMILMAMSGVVSYLLHPGWSGTYEFVLLLCAYLSLPMYMVYVREIRLTQRVLKCIYICNMATALFFIYSAVYRPEYYSGTEALTMGFFNPNQAAIFLVQNISVLLAIYGLLKKSISRIFTLLVCLIEIYLTVLTQSRTAVICAVVLVYFLFFHKRETVKKTTVSLVAILPVVVLSILLFFADNPTLAKMEIFGKPLLSGREELFAYALMSIHTSGRWIFGNFGAYLLGNLHNAYLSVYVSLGLIGLIVFYTFYYSQIKEFWKLSAQNLVSKMAFVGLLLLFVEGSVEAATLVSGSMYSAASAPLILLLNIRLGREQDEKGD